MVIDCGTCTVRGAACSDCVVSVLLGVPDVPAGREAPPGGVDLDVEQAQALGVLAEAGMVPRLRMVPPGGLPRVG